MISVQKNVSLKELTTFKIGGAADYFIAASTQTEMREALEWAREHQQPIFVFGGGSNILVNDAGFRGTVIQYSDKTTRVENSVLYAGSGCKLLAVVTAAAASSLSGLQNLTGIPGTIGGAVRGNAGAFGVEIKDVVTEVKALHQSTGEIKMFTVAECAFGYRTSYFKTNPDWIVLEATFTLTAGDSKQILAEGAAILAQRNRKQIQDIKSAGSTFINPVVNDELRKQFETEKGTTSHGGRVPAGWLIEKSGLRGARVGGAQSSSMHPNYLINTGEATSADVKELIELIKKAVTEKFGVELKEEIQYLGF